MGRRPSMRRTTSMTGITVDVVNAGEPEPSDVVDEFKANGYDHNQNSIAIVLPRYHQRSSSVGFKIEETAHFLKTCGLCNRRLAPGRDIYMYRYIYIYIYINLYEFNSVKNFYTTNIS